MATGRFTLHIGQNLDKFTCNFHRYLFIFYLIFNFLWPIGLKFKVTKILIISDTHKYFY